ncbi:MAG: DnaJ domain-containing protein [Bacilli bacterium]|nr:DnaJ domain-containing protein [Bacilli bacterium]
MLGIGRDSSLEEIKSAYQSMVNKYQPDNIKGETLKKILSSLDEARDVLLDSNKKREYDEFLDQIEHSKQFSKNKKETYSARTREYKNYYNDTYFTKWDFFINYFQNGIDSMFRKYIKFLLISINYLTFLVIKSAVFGILFLLYYIGELMNYIIGMIMFCAVLSLFLLIGNPVPDYIPYIPANVEQFLIFSTVASVLAMIKTLVLEKSLNLYVFFEKIEDYLFIFILMKS